MYADYVPADNPYAPGTFNNGLHLFTSADLIDWTHRGPILGPSPSRPACPYYLEPTLMVAEADSPEGPFSNRTPLLHSAAEGAWDS